MTVREMRKLLNSFGTEYDDCSVVIFNDMDKIEVKQIRKICSPMGKPCCVEIKLKNKA